MINLNLELINSPRLKAKLCAGRSAEAVGVVCTLRAPRAHLAVQGAPSHARSNRVVLAWRLAALGHLRSRVNTQTLGVARETFLWVEAEKACIFRCEGAYFRQLK